MSRMDIDGSLSYPTADTSPPPELKGRKSGSRSNQIIRLSSQHKAKTNHARSSKTFLNRPGSPPSKRLRKDPEMKMIQKNSHHQLIVADHTKDWQVVLNDPVGKNVVLYNRDERKCVVSSFPREDSGHKEPRKSFCPLCGHEINYSQKAETSPMDPELTPDYFLLIDSIPKINDSRLGEPREPCEAGDGKTKSLSPRQETKPQYGSKLPSEAFNEGYYNRFFEEKDLIGCGSFGSVYLCHHKLQGVILGSFAVKKIPVGNSTTWCLKVLKEVRILQTLHHRNIIDYKHSWIEHSQVSQFSPEVPCLFVLMEYADSGNLAKYVFPDSSLKSRKLSHLTVWYFLDDILQGLNHLHSAGLIHRDLKPENILLKREDRGNQRLNLPRDSKKDNNTESRARPTFRLLISDFGQAFFKSSNSVHEFSRIGNYGTIAYTAPEALVPDPEYPNPYTEACDMWSVGAMLYVMMYGDLPFEAETAELMRQEIYKKVFNLDQKQPKRPVELKVILNGLLRKDPRVRMRMQAALDIVDGAMLRLSNFAEKNKGSQMPERSTPVSTPIPLSKQLTPVLATREEEDFEKLEPLSLSRGSSRDLIVSTPDERKAVQTVDFFDQRHQFQAPSRSMRTNLRRSTSFSQRLWKFLQEHHHPDPENGTVPLLHLISNLFTMVVVLSFGSRNGASIGYSIPQILICSILIWFANSPLRKKEPWRTICMYLPLIGWLWNALFLITPYTSIQKYLLSRNLQVSPSFINSLVVLGIGVLHGIFNKYLFFKDLVGSKPDLISAHDAEEKNKHPIVPLTATSKFLPSPLQSENSHTGSLRELRRRRVNSIDQKHTLLP